MRAYVWKHGHGCLNCWWTHLLSKVSVLCPSMEEIIEIRISENCLRGVIVNLLDVGEMVWFEDLYGPN